MHRSFLGMDIRAGELRSVMWMLLHSLFMGASTVFFETAASALFLARFDADILPYVYLAAAAVGIVAGAGYGELKKRFEFSPLMVGTLASLIILTVSMRVGLALSDAAVLVFGLLVAYRLVSMLTDLEYWTLAARLYDVRQSKRLYGLVGAGEVVARVAGALSIPVLLGFIAVSDLFWLSAASLVACLATLVVIVRKFPRVRRSEQVEQNQERSDERQRGRLSFDSPYLRAIYLLSMAAVLGKYFVDFAFLQQIQTRHADVAELAVFFALFGGITQIINLLVRVFVSGRLLSRFGLRVGLLILPMAHLVCTLALVAVESTGSAALVFWLIILNQGLYKTLKHPIDNPSFKILYQPLARLKRLGAQITVEVMVTPIAIGIAAIAMLSMAKLDSPLLPPLMLVTFVLWSVAAVAAFHRYGHALFHALRGRSLDGTSLDLSDRKSMNLIRGYLTSDDPGDVLFAVDILERARDRSLADELIRLLQHPAVVVRRHTLLKIEELQLHEAVEAVEACLDQETDTAVKAAAIRAFCVVERRGSVSRAFEYTMSDDPTIQKGALIGLARHRDEQARAHAVALVQEMANAEDPQRRRLACEVLAEEPIGAELPDRLLSDNSIDVRRAAIRAACATGEPTLIGKVIETLELRALRQEAFEALLSRGTEVATLLADTLESRRLALAARRRLVRLCGRLRGAGTEPGLFRAYPSSEQSLRTEILLALERLGYQSDASSSGTIRGFIDQELRDGHWKMSILRTLPHKDSFSALASALREEIERNRNRALYLLAFANNDEFLLAAKRHLDAGSREKRAYAKEILDVRLDPLIRERLWPMLRPDTLPIGDPTAGSQFDNNLVELLSRTWESVSVWTRACALIAIRGENVSHLQPHITALKTHRNPLLAETATWLEESLSQTKPVAETSMLTIEKVLLLKRVDMFAETSEDILTEVADILEELTLDPNESIIRKGELGESMYIVISGRVRVFDGDKTINELGPREMFGELALLDPEPRSASVDAIEETRLFRLDRETFFELLEDNVGVVSGVMQVLCRRLRTMTVRAMEASARAS